MPEIYPPSGRNQASDAETLYDARSSTYDASWHPRFARHMVELAGVQRGEHVLDLACGTGLVAFAAARAAGPSGWVTGVDISAGMLAEARKKLASFPSLSSVSHPLDATAANVAFLRRSVTDLARVPELRSNHGPAFHVAICASALVLLEDPAAALRGWVELVRPGGRLVVDVTHPSNLAAGAAMERVGRVLGRPVPYYRLNFQKPEDLVAVMEAAGLRDVEVKFVSSSVNQKSDDLEDYLGELEKPVVSAVYSVDDAGAVFERNIGALAFKGLAEPPDVRIRAKEVFKQEWAAMADENGKVRDIDMVFVGIGRKPS